MVIPQSAGKLRLMRLGSILLHLVIVVVIANIAVSPSASATEV
jgi:hypothetical protein